MSRKREVEALDAHLTSFERWVDTDRYLHEQMATAEAEHAGAPIEALCADFDAQLDVTRTAIAFAKVCPPDGPDLDGLAGAAFVLALYQAVTEEIAQGLEDELAMLGREWGKWFARVSEWTPESNKPPPKRPSSPAQSRVLSVADELYGHLMERTRDQLVESLAQHAHEMTETISTGPGGEIIQTARFAFKRDETPVPDPAVPGTIRRYDARGLLPHLRMAGGRPWKVVRRKWGSSDWGQEMSAHWRAKSAFEAAHQARLDIAYDEMIDLYEWRWRGWLLWDSLPPLSREQQADGGGEVVWGAVGMTDDGATVGPVAVIMPCAYGWQIMVRSPDDRNVYVQPKKLRDAIYRIRAEAVDGARRVFAANRPAADRPAE